MPYESRMERAWDERFLVLLCIIGNVGYIQKNLVLPLLFGINKKSFKQEGF